VTACIGDSATIYIMVVNFRNSICPRPPQLSLHRRAALSSISNGTRSVYSRKNPKSSLYCVYVYGVSIYSTSVEPSVQNDLFYCFRPDFIQLGPLLPAAKALLVNSTWRKFKGILDIVPLFK
jgi:hypothetical protein